MIACLRRARRALIAIASAAVLAACASTPAPVLVTLPPTVLAAAVTSAPGVDARVLAVTRPDVPEYLVSRRVRYRADDATLAEWPNTFWAERVEIGVAREFAAALHEKLPDWRLCEINCLEQLPAIAIQVQLTRMDYFRNERRLLASVRISVTDGARTPKLLATRDHSYEVAGDADTAQSQARALSELLRRVAEDAAKAVRAGA